MDLKNIKLNISAVLQKYKFVMLILIVGIMLMIVPSKKEDIATTNVTTQDESETSFNVELANILSRIEGAGNVQVLLTVSVGEETVYQQDEDDNYDSDSSSSRSKTVILTSSDKAQYGLIKQINPPQYLGAVILCQGADRPSVKLAIIDAVGKITGLGADRISVLKMK